MDTLTVTKTQTISNTSLLVATMALLAAGGAAFAMVALPNKLSTTPAGAAPKLITCSDTDKGLVPLIKGTVTLYNNTLRKIIKTQTDSCVNSGTLSENYCLSDSAIGQKRLNCGVGSYCQSGACTPPPPVFTCTDSDGGKDLAVPGVTVIKNQNNALISQFMDFCNSPSIISEGFCANSSTIGVVSSTCPTGICQNGACMPKILSCLDSDGGFNMQQTGTTTVRDQNNNLLSVFIDSCTSANSLTEGFCTSTPDGSIMITSTVGCNNNERCAAGMCQPDNSLPNVVISGESPPAGSSQTMFVTTGTQLGRFKITNNGAAMVTITLLNFVDNGRHATTTYNLLYSDENSANYSAHTTAITVTGYGNDLLRAFTSIPINGGMWRYFTISVKEANKISAGDSWQLSAPRGNSGFSVKEVDLGFDHNDNGNLLDTINGTIDGAPVLGTIVKQ